jgi:tetratricopeptide (TPR) repeat protein
MRFPVVTLLIFSAYMGQAALGQEKGPVPSSQTDFSKEAYVVESLQTRVSEEADGTGTRERIAEIKILADAGVKAFAVLNFPYKSANEVVDVAYVQVRKVDGTIVKTPDYNVQEMPADITRTAPMYSDIHEKHIAVKGLGVGDVLQYSVRYRVTKAEIPSHFWFEHSFIKDAVVKKEQLEISFPKDKYVKVVSPEFKPDVAEEAGRRIYRWNHSNLEVKPKDPNEAPLRTIPIPSVQLTTFANWEEVGRWYEGLQKDAIEPTPAIRAKAAELTKNLKTDDEKIRALYNLVSLQFHYIGLDFGIGRYQPHSADDVLSNGYGDCKDKHTLLAALLKAAGYDAWPVLIHGERKLDPDVPSPAQFNHVITAVPMGGGQLIWLDTTPEVAPYQLLLNVLRDKQALVIPSNKAPFLTKTPQNPPFPQEQEFSAEGKLDAEGTMTAHIEQSYRGDAEVIFRSLFRQVAQSQWQQAVQGLSYRLGFGGEVSNIVASSPEDTSDSFKFSYDYVRKNYGDWDNRQIIPLLPPMGIEVAKDAVDKKPAEPVLLGAVGKLVYRSHIELPPGYSATLPTSVLVVKPYATYHGASVVEEGILTTIRELEITKSEVPLNDWEEYRKFGRAIADDEWSFMHLSRTKTAAAGKKGTGVEIAKGADEQFRDGTDALQSNDAHAAQEAFEEVIAANPNYPGAHMNLGIALGAQGKFADALAEFRQEEKISPDETRAYQAAASLATMLGRNEEAISELRKLLDLDPNNQAVALSLGGLLYRSGKYSDEADMLEHALKTSPDNGNLQDLLGMAYLKMGNSDKAVVHLRAAVEANGHDPMMLNDIAYTLAENRTNLTLAKQYAREALDKLDARSLDDVAAVDTGTRVTYELDMVWDTLGWIYFQVGETNLAESFVRPAWLLRQETVIGEHLGEIYEKEGKSKQAEHLYELALAAQAPPNVAPFPGSATAGMSSSIPDSTFSAYQKQRDEIQARYKKLTGKSAVPNESWRLPSGEWTKTGPEQLSEMCTVKLGKLSGVSGSAEYSVVFAPEKVESVEFIDGDDSLESLTDKLKATHYPVEFPEGSKAKILRRMKVRCTTAGGCTAFMLPLQRPKGRLE